MEKLPNREEDVMSILWKLKKAFVKEILTQMPGKFHYNTVSTIVRKLQEKGFVGHEQFGNTHRYYPLIDKETYSSQYMNAASKRFFNNSYKDMVAFFAEKEKISAEDLHEILNLIEKK